VNRYHAIVSTDSPDGIHKRVSVKADSLTHAREILAAQYGADKVVSLWGEGESALVRDK
jgi:6-phosphogluconolactonase/glucosamine-6-phosphate isomerase/deaminase